MSTNYWLTNSQSLGESYLSADQLPHMLTVEESDILLPYSDSQGNPTVGIGVNLTVPDNMALETDAHRPKKDRRTALMLFQAIRRCELRKVRSTEASSPYMVSSQFARLCVLSDRDRIASVYPALV